MGQSGSGNQRGRSDAHQKAIVHGSLLVFALPDRQRNGGAEVPNKTVVPFADLVDSGPPAFTERVETNEKTGCEQPVF
jgi:hypothetical protein